MLLDTSGLLALLHRGEPNHAAAVAAYDAAPIRVTHAYVLAELVPLAAARGYRRDLTLDFSTRVLAITQVAVVWVSESLHRDALDLLLARGDKNYSLCDAVSFVLMRQRRITDALTTDRHFEQEGFRRLLS
jgi:predicted nucleic acid-binding protein